MDFQSPDLLSSLLTATTEDLDGLDFGVILMTPDGTVTAYNAPETRLSGLSREKVIGRHFFKQIAPCTDNFMVSHRFETEPDLDATIDYVFTLKMRPTPVKLRLLRAADADRMALAVRTVGPVERQAT